MPLAVIGAGLAGLSLALHLSRLRPLQITLFQRDLNFQSRRQGYGLTLMQATRMIRRLGIQHQVKQHSKSTNSHFIFNPKGDIIGFYGTVFWNKFEDKQGISTHISRQTLRKIIYQKLLQQNRVQFRWSADLKQIAFSQDKFDLTFQDFKVEGMDLVVGCDGIYSKVRRLCTDDDNHLKYLGVVVVLGICTVQHDLNRQTIFQTSDGKFRFYSMPFDGQKTMWQLSFKMQFEQGKRLVEDAGRVRAFVLKALQGWHSPVIQMISSTEPHLSMSLLAYDRDPKLPNFKYPKVILLGDALHPMSPFKGQGANQALLDSLFCTENIDRQQTWIMQQCLKRAERKVLSSRQRAQTYHSEQVLNSNKYLYAGIDLQLIRLLEREGLSAGTEQLVRKVLAVMNKYNYL